MDAATISNRAGRTYGCLWIDQPVPCPRAVAGIQRSRNQGRRAAARPRSQGIGAGLMMGAARAPRPVKGRRPHVADSACGCPLTDLFGSEPSATDRAHEAAILGPMAPDQLGCRLLAIPGHQQLTLTVRTAPRRSRHRRPSWVASTPRPHVRRRISAARIAPTPVVVVGRVLAVDHRRLPFSGGRDRPGDGRGAPGPAARSRRGSSPGRWDGSRSGHPGEGTRGPFRR